MEHNLQLLAMNPETMGMVFTIAGTIILTLFSIIGYFMKSIIKDLKETMQLNSAQQSRIEAMEKVHAQEMNTIKEIHESKVDKLGELTELRFQQVNENIGNLTSSLKEYVDKTSKQLDSKDSVTAELIALIKVLKDKEQK